MNHTTSGLVLFSLLVLLTGCSSSKPQVIRVPFETTVIEKIQTPANLLEACDIPALDTLQTNKDLETALGEAIISLASCNEDKEGIRIWQGEE